VTDQPFAHDASTPVQARVPNHLLARVDAARRNLRLSRSAVINLALRRYLAELESGLTATPTVTPTAPEETP